MILFGVCISYICLKASFRIQLCLFVYSRLLPLCSLYKMILQAHVIFFLLQIPELITKQISLTLLGWN